MSCLFQSIGKLVQQSHVHVRHKICDYMQHHLDSMHQGMTLRHWIQWQRQSSNAEQYIRNMRSTSEWGGAMELMVATKVYNADIIVVDGYGKQVAEFLLRDAFTARKRMYVQWTGVHYEPVRMVHV